MGGRLTVASAVAGFASTLLALSSTARAEGLHLHWDAGAQLGIMQRVTSGRGDGASQPWPGPVGELHAHLALIPMVRVGAYVAHDISPARGMTAREITAGGLRLKITPPLLPAPWRAWAFAGVGYARAYAPSHRTTAAPDGFVPGEGGGFLDVPVGLGAGVRARGRWTVFVELGVRLGLAFTGTMYDAHRCACGTAFEGRDSFAAALAVGVSLEE
jgi:hypothetical protein